MAPCPSLRIISPASRRMPRSKRSQPSREAGRAPAAPRSRLISHRAFFVLLPSSAEFQGPRRSDAGLVTFSEWNLFARRRFLGFASGRRLGPGSEELDPLRYDLRTLALAAAVFALKFSRAQPAFNVNLQ